MWVKKDEEKAEKLTLELAKFLAENDRENIKQAGKHVEESLIKTIKGLFKPVKLIPGVGAGKAMAESLGNIMIKSFAASYVRTNSISSGGRETQPYNFLANLFAKVLQDEASKEEKVMFARHFIRQATTVAGAMVPGTDGIASVATDLVEIAARTALEKGAALIVDQLSDDAVKGALEGTRSSAVAWAVYLSGTPRNKQRASSAIENCRLALRVSMGMPYDFIASGVSGYVHFHFTPDKRYHIVDPSDVAELFTDMIKGDVAENFEKIKQFSWYEGEMNQTKHKEHISYLELILKGLKVWDKLVKKPFTLR